MSLVAVPIVRASSDSQDGLDRDDLTVDELVDAANAVLVRIAPKQSRYKVTEHVDVRTIRYYASRKLLPRALGYQGGRARYGNKHLLRLLLIKRMQAEELTLEQLAEDLRTLARWLISCTPRSVDLEQP